LPPTAGICEAVATDFHQLGFDFIKKVNLSFFWIALKTLSAIDTFE
jgi:hypothetical protein